MDHCIEEHLERARIIFENTDIQVPTDGHKYLDGAIGNEMFKSNYIKTRVNEWVD